MFASTADAERRVRALRAEIASRDAMLEAVQAQTTMDVEHARRERDDAREALGREKSARDEALEALCATNAENARMKGELEALRAQQGEASAREAAARAALEEATARLAVAESACANASVKCGGAAFVAPTPGRSPSAVPLKKKVAMLEARARDDLAERKAELERFLTREKTRSAQERRAAGTTIVATTISTTTTTTTDPDAPCAADVSTPPQTSSTTGVEQPLDVRDVTLTWGLARSEALDGILELLERACVVLERASTKVRVRDPNVVDVEEDDVDVDDEPRSWEDVARDLRDPDAALQELTQWIDERSSDDNAEHHDAMIRVSSAVHHVVFALKRSAGAAAASERETREAYALADEASQMFRLRLAQAETAAKLALSRATAAEDANETISRLASDARRDAEASSKIAEAARRDLKRRESELAMRELASKLTIDVAPTVCDSPAAHTPTSRPMAPFPTPDVADRPRGRRADLDAARRSGENLSPALRELQNLRRSFIHDRDDDDDVA